MDFKTKKNNKCLFCEELGHDHKMCPFIKAYLYCPSDKTKCSKNIHAIEYVKMHNLAKKLFTEK